MKKILLTIALALSASTMAEARIGYTLKECIAKYGRPIQKAQEGLATEYYFRVEGFHLSATLFEGKTCIMRYVPDNPLTDLQAMEVLQRNSPTTWKNGVEKRDMRWFSTVNADKHDLTATLDGEKEKVSQILIVDDVCFDKLLDVEQTKQGETIKGL